MDRPTTHPANNVEHFDILIIDSRDISRKATYNLLTHAGYTVDTAIHGKDGIEKLRENRFNYRLVITELIMPYAGGFEVIKFLKSNSSIPVIVLSAVSDERTIHSIFDVNADDFLKKPFIAGELKQRISRLISYSRTNINPKSISEIGDSDLDELRQFTDEGVDKLDVDETKLVTPVIKPIIEKKPSKNTATKKSPAKKAVKKTATKKETVKKETVKKTPAKKTATKKVAVKKEVKAVKKTATTTTAKKQVVEKKSPTTTTSRAAKQSKSTSTKSPAPKKVKSVLIG